MNEDSEETVIHELSRTSAIFGFYPEIGLKNVVFNEILSLRRFNALWERQRSVKLFRVKFGRDIISQDKDKINSG